MSGATFIHRSEHLKVLSWLVDHCRENLPANKTAQDYLSKNGLADESVWGAFRVGVGDKQLLDGFGAEDRVALDELGLLPYKGPPVLWQGGILIPTFDPADASQPVGLIKLNYGQNKHAFATPARGLACSADIGEHKRIVIVDGPLLGMRLASAGVQGVAIAEKPDVLPMLSEWLAGREVVFAAYKPKPLAAFRAILPASVGVQVHTDLLNSNVETLKLLGISKRVEAVSVPELAAPSFPALLRQVIEYSAKQIASGKGGELLATCDGDCAAFVEAFGVGYLPADFQSTLPEDCKDVLGTLAGDCLIVPAFDEEDVAVGALLLTKDLKQSWIGAQGLMAPRVASAYTDVKVTDSLRTAADLFRSGEQNIICLPSVENAEANVSRLRKSVVCSARVIVADESTAKGIHAALNSAAIVDTPTVEVAAPLPADVEPATATAECTAKPELVNHDVRTMRAKFRAGETTYEIETALDCGSKLEVRVEREGLVHLDRFDLSKAAQRKRFSESAAMKTKTPFEVIEAHLIHLLDTVRVLQEELLNPSANKVHTVNMSDAERTEARELLKQPNLLEIAADDMEAMGWTGEATNKRLLYLCAVSRFLSLPVSAALRAPASAGKSCALETICALTPPEDVVHISRASAAAFHLHPDLRHKLVMIDEADALSQEVVVALRVLQSRGALSQSVVERDALTGKAVTRVGETKGPVAVFTSTTQEMDAEFIARCYDLSVDTSPEQTQRILEAQRRVRSDIDQYGNDGRRAAIFKRHHTLQRVLGMERRTVVIPFGDRIEFPSTAVQFRREQQKLLSLIEASALLHSFNRLKQKNRSGEDVIVADLRDFEIAVQLVSPLIHRANDELTASAWDVLDTVRKAGLSAFTLADVQCKRPDWTRHKIYAGLEALAGVEIVTCSRGRGKKRQYVLQSGAGSFEAAAVRLREVGELSKLSNPLDNNFTPVRAIG